MSRKISIIIFIIFSIIGCSSQNIKEQNLVSEKNIKYYTFTYKGKANSVYIAGNFNNWRVADPKFKMIQKENNTWEIKIPETDLLKGENEYKFIVDGEWVVDINAPIIRDTKLAGKIGIFKVE